MFCPKCGKEIPDGSKFCPYCGYQIAKVKGEERVQTIELTSKRLKKQLLYSVALIIVGLILVGSGKPGSATQYFGGFVIFIGFVWLIVTRIKIWWNHK
jgi:uncharacterized membrane protein YvbJ